MIVYHVSGLFLRTQAEAKDHARKTGTAFNAERDTVVTPNGHKDMVDFLNELATKIAREAVANRVAPAPVPVPQPVATSQANSYSERSVSLDETFLNAPIPQQLTLAILAMEHARRVIEHPVEKLVIDHLAKKPPVDDLV